MVVNALLSVLFSSGIECNLNIDYMLTESRRRKTRNWEEEDYYDSDEDNFLDRTGTVERKREQRMKQAGKLEETVETYNSLVIDHFIQLRLLDIFLRYCNVHVNVYK